MKFQQTYRPQHGGYVSEFTSFINGYQRQHPNMEKDQQHGWYLLWDKHVDFDELKEEEQANIPLKPGTYYYE
jgi:hypothetical protein